MLGTDFSRNIIGSAEDIFNGTFLQLRQDILSSGVNPQISQDRTAYFKSICNQMISSSQ